MIKLLFFICIVILVIIVLYDKKSEYSCPIVDDVSMLNTTIVDKVFYPKCNKDIFKIIKLAHFNNKKIIARGERHSMGGHTITKDGYIIDTKFLNQINLDGKNMVVKVGPGVTWDKLIYYLNRHGYSPKTLQSYASFSVGGSVSVNIHGITNDDCLCESIKELELITSSAEIVVCSRSMNSELFSLVIGGYGLFGIIVNVTLEIVPNVCVTPKSKQLTINNFCQYYHKISNSKTNIKFARIDITNMKDITLYYFTKNNNTIHNLELDKSPNKMSIISQLLYKWLLPIKYVQKIRFNLENRLGKPLDMKKSQKLSRNMVLYESAKPLSILYSPIINLKKTHILQEFFIPEKYFIVWMKYLEKIFSEHNEPVLLNITIRYIKEDKTTFLKYATQNMFAFVFYYRINCTTKEDHLLKKIHNLLTNKSLELTGTFYLPYRHHYTKTQLKKSYPNITDFFVMKKKYDPYELFTNLWYENYKK